MNTSDAPNAVEITGLSRRFGSKLALNQVSLQVQARARLSAWSAPTAPAKPP